ncbi:protein takeout-like isoform X3 [Macrosteles quadrilineatus]|uniref:protein takeout-like isoform X3 n=1 Tax=Macrosteles quadrilineatus TaxID=74068 RepID=UPI0023E26A7F|nr:protein takeout-like isoform X3 [Macrosteles quadrilineatus]XP_054262488.1 protein takeout-like isoform X3 [Macrosteles quadrilineatus]
MAAYLQMLTVLIACAVLLTPSLAQKAPRFKACKRGQPKDKLDECVRDSLQRAVPELVKGLPEYGLLTIDPLHVESLQVTKGSNQKKAVNVDISFKNLDIIGLKNAKIKSVDMDVDNYKMKAKIDIEGPILLQGDYTIKGKVLVLPIEGSGKCNITLVNPKGEITDLSGKPITKDGKQYAQVNTLKFVVKDVERVHYDLENLFNGNKELGNNMNLVLNDNWKEVYQDMKAPVESALSLAFREATKKVFKIVPYNRVFP